MKMRLILATFCVLALTSITWGQITWLDPILDAPNGPGTTGADLIGGPLIQFEPLAFPNGEAGPTGGNAAGLFFTEGGGDTTNAQLNEVYNSHGWNAPEPIVIDGLTMGNDYQIQLLAAGDTRGCCAERWLAADDLMGNISGDFQRGNSSVVGTFTASSSVQLIDIIAGPVAAANGDATQDPGLSGYILTDGAGELIRAINYAGGTARPLVDVNAEPPPPPLTAVPRDIVPTPDLGPGNWNVRIIGIDTRPDGSGDGDINDHAEARAILEYAGPYQGDWISSGQAAGEAGAGGGPSPNEALNLNGWGIYEDHQESRNVVDLGGDNSFEGTQPYPGPDPPNLTSEDFLVHATTEEPFHFAPNTNFAINFGSDDGGLLRIEPADGSTFSFTNEPVGSNGDAGLDNQIGFNGNRGHSQTCGEFTTGPDGLSAHIDVSMHERGGGDNLEVSVAEGGCAGFGNGPFQLLGDNALVTDDGSFLVSVDPANLSGGGPPTGGGGDDLPCDLNGDGVCDTADLDVLYADNGDIDAWLTQASENDGIEGANQHLLGDANLDGNVDSTDLGLLLNNFNGNGGTAATWSGGDLNNSGGVDSTDLGLLLNNFNFTSASTNAVPEPNSMVLLCLGAFALLRRRR